jgi:hypothetical protein
MTEDVTGGTMSEKGELLACPFCGGTEVEFIEHTHWTGQRQVVLAVTAQHYCGDRRVINFRCKTRDEAAAAWNTRTPEGR